jgi:AcrR family transcriptional regulator
MAVAASRKRRAPSKTRERILEASLRLFNELGAPHVTTNHISDEVGISPGNLYYHFRHKEDIILALYDRYETRIGPIADGGGGQPGSPDDLWLLVHMAFEAIHDFRFIYRDLADLNATYASLRTRFSRNLERSIEGTAAYCRKLMEEGVFDASSREVDALATNIALVSAYWLNLHGLRRGVRGATPLADDEVIAQGVFQVLSLITPYLQGEAKRSFREIAARYTVAQ